MIPYVVVAGVGEQPLTLHYDCNAIELLQQETGMQDLGLIADHAARFNMRVIRLLFWTALRRHHPDLTQEAAGALIDGQTLKPVMDGITQAYGRFIGVDPNEAPPSPPPAGSASPSS